MTVGRRRNENFASQELTIDCVDGQSSNISRSKGSKGWPTTAST